MITYRIYKPSEFKDFETLLNLLKELDKLFDYPISERVELEEYAKKIIEKVHLFMAFENDDPIALLVGYCNTNSISYMSSLAVKREFQGSKIGVAKQLITLCLDFCYNCNTTKIRLECHRRMIPYYSKYNAYVIESFKRNGIDKFILEKNMEE